MLGASAPSIVYIRKHGSSIHIVHAWHVASSEASFDATISALDAETSRSCGVTGDCGVCITPEMCNRVTDHGDMSSFFKPALSHICRVIPAPQSPETLRRYRR